MLDIIKLLEYETWEEVPDEDLWEDGELDSAQVQHKIIKHIMQTGDWKLMRRKEWIERRQK